MKIEEVDWKDANQLRRYISEKGKIRSRRITGACRRHQRQVAAAIKRAREMALLPYVAEGRDDRPEGGRRDRGDRDRDRDRWRAISGARQRPQSRPYRSGTNAPCVLPRLASGTPEARHWNRRNH